VAVAAPGDPGDADADAARRAYRRPSTVASARARYVGLARADQVLIHGIQLLGPGTAFAVLTGRVRGVLPVGGQGSGQCPASDASGQTKTLFACT
jgi:hypothetical protein